MSKTSQLVSRLFAREPPPLEPGTKLWAPELKREIAGLQEHRYVIAGE